MGIVRAQKLEPGSKIGIVCTGSPVSPERFQLGCQAIQSYGYEIVVPLNPSEFYGKYDHGFTNGSAFERVRSLDALLDAPEVSVIIAARGGYGSMDMLPLIDFEKVRSARKVIVGCSDSTVLLMQWMSRASLCAIHGTSVGSCLADARTNEEAKRSADALIAMLTSPDYRYSIPCEVIRSGAGEGVVVAGNMSMFTSVLGTPWDLNFDGLILVLEEVAEAPYKIQRMLTQLKLAGKFDRLAGLVFGRFARCTAQHGPQVGEVIKSFVSDTLSGLSFPVVMGFPFGHWGENQPVPVGCRAVLQDGVFSLLEPPVG